MNSLKSWYQARDSCFAEGAVLLPIAHQNENVEIWSTLSSNVWIGGNDFENEGIWKWVTGASIDYYDIMYAYNYKIYLINHY